jgi:hypothetical protein
VYLILTIVRNYNFKKKKAFKTRSKVKKRGERLTHYKPFFLHHLFSTRELQSYGNYSIGLENMF